MIGAWFTYGVVDALRRRRLLLAYLVGLGTLFVAGLVLTGRFIEARVGQQLVLLTRDLQSLAYFPIGLLLGLFFGADAAGEATGTPWLFFGATRASGRFTYILGRLLAALTMALTALLFLSLTAGIVLWAATGSFYALILDAVLLLFPGLVFMTSLGYLLRLHLSVPASTGVGLVAVAACFGFPLLWDPLYYVLPALLPLFADHTAMADFHAVTRYPFELVQLTGWSAVLVLFAHLRLGRLWFDDPFG
jgi:ABC-type transport system involved in multi-copper enzyme maturation permease subunit